MSDPTLALQKALYERLAEALDCPVFDAVPDKQSYPYVTLDREFSKNTSPITGKQRENRLFYLSVWSDYPGQKVVKQIMMDIAAALNEKPLPLETGRAVSVRVARTESTRDRDGKTYMGSVTLRIITQH